MGADRLPAGLAEQLASPLAAIGDALNELTIVSYTLPPPLAQQLRRRLRGEILAALDVALAAPPEPPEATREPV